MSNTVSDGKCLMIKTKDHRKFYTHEKNFLQLIEFSKLFNAEVSVVKVKDASMLELPDLAPALCDATYSQEQPAECQIIEVKIAQNKKSRQNILKSAKKIQEYIKNQFLKGEIVSLKKLSDKFKPLKVTNACLCTHLKLVRNDLESQGYVVTKTGGGKYTISK